MIVADKRMAQIAFEASDPSLEWDALSAGTRHKWKLVAGAVLNAVTCTQSKFPIDLAMFQLGDLVRIAESKHAARVVARYEFGPMVPRYYRVLYLDFLGDLELLTRRETELTAWTTPTEE